MRDIHNKGMQLDGPEGLAAAERHTADLIILDVMMPGLSGFEVS